MVQPTTQQVKPTGGFGGQSAFGGQAQPLSVPAGGGGSFGGASGSVFNTATPSTFLGFNPTQPIATSTPTTGSLFSTTTPTTSFFGNTASTFTGFGQTQA